MLGAWTENILVCVLKENTKEAVLFRYDEWKGFLDAKTLHSNLLHNHCSKFYSVATFLL